MALEIQTGGGLWTWKYILGSNFQKSLQKIALPFQILLFFQTTDLLPHIFLVSIHRLALVYTFVEAMCDNLKISRKIA